MEFKGNKSMVFGKPEVQNTLKVFAWTVGAALIVLAIDLLGVIEMPAEYAFVVPLANTILYALKEWVADNRF